jgi:hypothetical protein
MHVARVICDFTRVWQKVESRYQITFYIANVHVRQLFAVAMPEVSHRPGRRRSCRREYGHSPSGQSGQPSGSGSPGSSSASMSSGSMSMSSPTSRSMRRTSSTPYQRDGRLTAHRRAGPRRNRSLPRLGNARRIPGRYAQRWHIRRRRFVRHQVVEDGSSDDRASSP